MKSDGVFLSVTDVLAAAQFSSCSLFGRNRALPLSGLLQGGLVVRVDSLHDHSGAFIANASLVGGEVGEDQLEVF